ncbi:hypothetical protein ON010_g9739 [Phytophthora cinnamomi]|nr:hypothetical protein ON010_g9739 [Phytophthora cinnamomi]
MYFDWEHTLKHCTVSRAACARTHATYTSLLCLLLVLRLAALGEQPHVEERHAGAVGGHEPRREEGARRVVAAAHDDRERRRHGQRHARPELGRHGALRVLVVAAVAHEAQERARQAAGQQRRGAARAHEAHDAAQAQQNTVLWAPPPECAQDTS